MDQSIDCPPFVIFGTPEKILDSYIGIVSMAHVALSIFCRARPDTVSACFDGGKESALVRVIDLEWVMVHGQ